MSLETILGSKFINNKFEEQNQIDIFNTPLICLYFTAKWSSPCEIFTKELLEIYEDANEGDKIFEIIHIPFDKSDSEFKSSISDKPWVFIPLNDERVEQIKNKFKVTSIPVFLLIDKNGNILSDTCRKDISSEGPKVIDTWLKLVGRNDLI